MVGKENNCQESMKNIFIPILFLIILISCSVRINAQDNSKTVDGKLSSRIIEYISI